MALTKYNARRSFLKCLPAFAAGLAVTPAIGAASPGEKRATVILGAAQTCAAAPLTPVMRKYRKWVEFTAWINTEACDLPEPEWEEAVNAHSCMEDDLIATPSANPLDVIAKIAAYSNFGQNGLPNDPALWDEARAMLA